jgi:FdhD protein
MRVPEGDRSDPDPLARAAVVETFALSPRRPRPLANALASAAREDWLAHEEPLEIKIGGRRFAVVMRTPGHDLELVRGLLFSEGIIDRSEDVAAIAHCRSVPVATPETWHEAARDNVVLVTLAKARRAVRWRRSPIHSSCGVCGRATVEELRTLAPAVTSDLAVDARLLAALPEKLRASQHGFAKTGGLHAAALFDGRGRLLVAREDVGRHNAVDKVVGAALLHHLLPLSRCVLQVSGRASFEIVQKARRAGIPIVSAVSAPSSLAVLLARDGGQTLIGFARAQTLNVYCGADRVRAPAAAPASAAAARAAPSPAARRRPRGRRPRSGSGGRPRAAARSRPTRSEPRG